MCKLIKVDCKKILGLIVPIIIVVLTSSALSQTIEYPVEVTIKPISLTTSLGQRSAVEIIFKIPRGFWLGDNDPSTRIPSTTSVVMKIQDNFSFEKALFPKPKVVGIPVHKGTSRIFKGKLHVIVPYTVSKDLADGEYT